MRRMTPRILLLFLVALLAAPPSAGHAHQKESGASSGEAKIAGCPLFPSDNIWNTPIDHLPVDPRSDEYVASIGRNTGLHPDFGTIWEGAPIGIPYNIVSSSRPRYPVNFMYEDESDPGPYPVGGDLLIEGGPDSQGDRHVLIVDQDECVLYELYRVERRAGGWHAGSGAIFDLDSNLLRPDGWTSADAAGLPILAGLVRYDEVVAGEIAHALRFTASRTRKAHVWPARHDASSITDPSVPPMGQRFRLKASFDTSGFSPQVQVILQALKTYGMILADNGSNWYISGAPDSRWDDSILVEELRRVKGSDFEAADSSALMVHRDSGQAATEARRPADQKLWIPFLTG